MKRCINIAAQFRVLKLATAICFILIFRYDAFAQMPEHPPRPITVTVDLLQPLNFGTFARTNGGEIAVYADGSRHVLDGDLILIGAACSPADFYVEGNPGTVISITNGSNVIINGNGGTVLLKIGESDQTNPFVLTSSSMIVRIGGSLVVGNQASSPDGVYNGQFTVTFNQE